MQYIKECRPLVIVQYEKHILQRIQKWKEKWLGKMGDGLPSIQTPSSHSQVD